MLGVTSCGVRNDGVSNLVPDGDVNIAMSNLNIRYNGIQCGQGRENFIALASRYTNLDSSSCGKCL